MVVELQVGRLATHTTPRVDDARDKPANVLVTVRRLLVLRLALTVAGRPRVRGGVALVVGHPVPVALLLPLG